ncbi:hypothetical protein L218DRAFT_430215 [Marasmius fiardii PR-910]|nr:hypothetical protein L218DRAFT_430215 [Marasmius fiardii PR-910]
MTDVDSSHYNEEKLSELFDTVWTGYGADTLNPTSGPSRSRRSNRPLPPTPGSATSSPVSARPYGLDSPDGSTPSSRQLPFRPTTHFTQSPTEEAAPHSPFPPPPPPPIVNRAYVEDTPAYSPPYPGYNHSFPSDEKTPAFIPPPPPPPVQWSSPGASSSGLGVSSSSSRYQCQFCFMARKQFQSRVFGSGLVVD